MEPLGALSELGLTVPTSADAIRRAYLRRVRAHPPERDPERFRKIRDAYELLKDAPWLWVEKDATSDDDDDEDSEADGGAGDKSEADGGAEFGEAWVPAPPTATEAAATASGDASPVEDFPEAVVELRSAKARNNSSPVFRYKLIIALWSAGQITAAESEIDHAMQLWPQHGAIWQTKIKLLALTGRPKQALALASDPAARPLDQRDAPDMRGRLLFLTALSSGSRTDAQRAIDATA